MPRPRVMKMSRKKLPYRERAKVPPTVVSPDGGGDSDSDVGGGPLTSSEESEEGSSSPGPSTNSSAGVLNLSETSSEDLTERGEDPGTGTTEQEPSASGESDGSGAAIMVPESSTGDLEEPPSTRRPETETVIESPPASSTGHVVPPSLVFGSPESIAYSLAEPSSGAGAETSAVFGSFSTEEGEGSQTTPVVSPVLDTLASDVGTPELAAGGEIAAVPPIPAPSSTGNLGSSPSGEAAAVLSEVATAASSNNGNMEPPTNSQSQVTTVDAPASGNINSPSSEDQLQLPPNLAEVCRDVVNVFHNTRSKAKTTGATDEATGSGKRKRKRESRKGGNPKPRKKRKKSKSKRPLVNLDLDSPSTNSSSDVDAATALPKDSGQKKKRKKKKKNKIKKNVKRKDKKKVKIAKLAALPRGDTPPRTLLRYCEMVADWDEYLTNLEDVRWVCPVDYFIHAPFATTWETFARRGIKIEVRHPQMVGRRRVNCIATIVEFAGYKALMQFEKMGQGPDQYAWLSYCGQAAKHLSYSVNNGILLLPVQGLKMMDKADANFEKLGKKLCEKYFGKNGKPRPLPDSISPDHENQIYAELERHNRQVFGLGKIVEVIARDEPTRMRFGIVVSVIGDRIVVQYLTNPEKKPVRMEARVEVSMKSDLVQRIGWSNTVGVPLKNIPKDVMAFPFLSNRNFPSYPSDLKIQHNMVFELRHPRRPYQIVSGYVFQRLHLGYFIACVDTNEKGDDTKYTLHVTSDYILPCGFCEKNNIPLEVPLGEKPENFSWEAFCNKRKTSPLDLEKLPKKPRHKFVKECKMEAAADVLQPNYFGPATVMNVAEHLMLIHFDGWPQKKPQYSQWVSAFSPDLYPAGWAEMVGHDFQSHAVPHAPENSYYIAKGKNKSNKIK